MPETLLLWAAWSGVILAMCYLTEVISYPRPEWVEPLVQTLAIWLNFLTWSWLLALTSRIYLEQPGVRLPAGLQKIPPTCLVTMTALAGGLIVERCSGGLLRYLESLNPPGSLLAWWRDIVMVAWCALFVMLFCAAGFHLLLAAKKQRTLSKLGMYLLHYLTLAVIFGGVVFVGILLAFGLIEMLFAYHQLWKWTLVVAATCELIWPTLAMLLVLPTADFDLQAWKVNRFWQICGLYLAGPLLAIYDVILYVYLAKQAVIWQWPEYGMVNLVLWFALLATMWLLLSDCLREQSKKVAQVYAKGLAISLVPLLVLAGWGLSQRTLAFGWTQLRFLVMIGLLWVVSSLFCWWREKTSIILLTTAILALSAGVFAPACVQISQKRLHADAWLKELYPYADQHPIRPTAQAENEAGKQWIGFYGNLGRLWRFYADVREYDLLLAPTDVPQTVALDDETWTWYWHGDNAQAQDSGVLHLASSSGELTLDVTPLLAELNKQCELTKPSSEDRYNYGCDDNVDFSLVWETLKPHGLEHFQDGVGASWKVDLDDWEAHVLLSKWRGQRDDITGELNLEEIDGVALLKKL